MLQYFHACLFSPTKSTLLKAIQNGNLATWPALTHNNVHKYMDETTATALGHLDQCRQGLQSTKTTHIADDDLTPKAIPSATNQVIAQIISFKQNNKGYFDLTGPFPTLLPEEIDMCSHYMHMIQMRYLCIL